MTTGICRCALAARTAQAGAPRRRGTSTVEFAVVGSSGFFGDAVLSFLDQAEEAARSGRHKKLRRMITAAIKGIDDAFTYTGGGPRERRINRTASQRFEAASRYCDSLRR